MLCLCQIYPLNRSNDIEIVFHVYALLTFVVVTFICITLVDNNIRIITISLAKKTFIVSFGVYKNALTSFSGITEWTYNALVNNVFITI